MLNLFRRLAGRLGGSTGASTVPPIGRPDISAEDAAILARVSPFTMTSEERLLGVIDTARYIAQFRIPGAVVECGTWRGGSSMAAALGLLASGESFRDLYLYDTFEGMTAPTTVDRSHDGVAAAHQLDVAPTGTGVWCRAGLDEVRGNMASTGYPIERVRFVQGRVEETIPKICPDQIALLRLDTDWYESTLHELEHLFPRLSPGGILIIDDYGHWDGCRRAVDEYFARNQSPILLVRLDYTGRIAIKVA